MTTLDLAHAAARLDRLVTVADNALSDGHTDRHVLETLLADLDVLLGDMRAAGRLSWCPLCADAGEVIPAPRIEHTAGAPYRAAATRALAAITTPNPHPCT